MGYLIGFALVVAILQLFYTSMRRPYHTPPFDDVYGFDPDDDIYWDAPAHPLPTSGYYPSGPYLPQQHMPPVRQWQSPYAGAYYQPPAPMAAPRGPVYSPDYRYVLNPYTGQWMEQ